MPLRLFVLFGGLLMLLPVGHAQDRNPFKEPPPPKATGTPLAKEQRNVYAVRGDAAGLAQVVSKHFKNKVTVSVVSDSLVLSGEADDLKEVTALLTRIDRPARTVEIEVTIIESTAKGDGPAAALPPAADLLAKADDLSKGGATVQRIKLTATEGQAVSVQTGGNKPYTSSMTGGRGNAFGAGGAPGAVPPGLGGGGGGGPAQRSIMYHQVGTTVKAIARVEADSAVGIELSVQDSTIKPPEAGDEAAGGAPTFETASLSTHVSVPAGKAVVAQAVRKDAKASRTTTLVIVTAKVVEAGR